MTKGLIIAASQAAKSLYSSRFKRLQMVSRLVPDDLDWTVPDQEWDHSERCLHWRCHPYNLCTIVGAECDSQPIILNRASFAVSVPPQYFV